MERLSDLTRAQIAEARSLDYVRWLSAVHMGYRQAIAPLEVFRTRWPGSVNMRVIETHVAKAAVPAGAGSPGAWGSALSPAPTELAAAFVEYARPLTLIGRLTSLRRMPFNTRAITTTTGAATFAWVGAGRPKPLSALAFTQDALTNAVAAGIVVVTDELIRLQAPGSAEMLREDLARGLAAFLDASFLDPTEAGTTGVSPASITNGVSAAASSTGVPLTDLRELLRAFVAGGGQLSSAVILLSSQNAAALALRTGGSDEPLFPGLTVSGGTLAGLPALASDAVGSQLICVDARRVLLADDGRVAIDASGQASIEMLDNPTTNAVTATATNLVSMFQSNCTALRVERYVNWLRVGAIAIVDGVNYLAEGGSPA